MPEERLIKQHNMKSVIINETQKIITSESGMVLTNGGEFADYPVELTVNIEDETWSEIPKPEEIITEIP